MYSKEKDQGTTSYAIMSTKATSYTSCQVTGGVSGHSSVTCISLVLFFSIEKEERIQNAGETRFSGTI